jgi:hypothetical protein
MKISSIDFKDKKMINISFDKNNILFCAEDQAVYAQPLSDYPRLSRATSEQKAKWKLSNVGIHWEEIDEDVSFESFFYEKDDPLVVKATV